MTPLFLLATSILLVYLKYLILEPQENQILLAPPKNPRPKQDVSQTQSSFQTLIHYLLLHLQSHRLQLHQFLILQLDPQVE